MENPLTLKAFGKWAAKREGSYQYVDSETCACARYAWELGLPYHVFDLDERKREHELSGFWEQIEYAAKHAPTHGFFWRTRYTDLANFIRTMKGGDFLEGREESVAAAGAALQEELTDNRRQLEHV